MGVLLLAPAWLQPGCSGSVDMWQARCGAAFRGDNALVESCLAEAKTTDQRCEMELELALRRKAEGTEVYLAGLQHVLALPCGELSLRAGLRMAGALLEAGDALGGATTLADIVDRYPESYAAGEAVILASRYREVLSSRGVRTWDFYLSRYERLKYSRVAGHLLYLAVQDGRWAGAVGTRKALYLLLLLVDYHPESPYWDEAVEGAADMLSGMGFVADEVRLLEDALLPNRARGMDALLDGFAQRLRLRLARLYARQGRFEEALIQLGWVINAHSAVTLKDDGLLLASDVQRWQGDLEGAKRTLQFLIRECPWSRHVESVRNRLGEVGVDERHN